MGLESKVVEDIPREREPAVDREKTCPLLLRVFCNYNGRHNNKNDYGPRNTPPNELQIYTWMDATLKEITNLVTEVNPEAKKKGTQFNFCVCFPSSNTPGYRMREIGTTTASKKGPDDSATLASKRFVIGDYLDVAITYARNVGSSSSGATGNDYRDSRSRRARPY